VKIVESILQRTGRTHPATKTFQGIRIHVNNELEHLELALAQLSDLLSENGVIVIISFHSLEDRIVKNFFKPDVQFLPKDIPINNIVTEKFQCIKKKVKPSAEEIKRNPRSRSAVMRVFSKA
ncbi:MAG: 16S rRNA (cytosine(1402)-N(4))-methyltransferase, partial [Gammaproteobacteria bacterium]